LKKHKEVYKHQTITEPKMTNQRFSLILCVAFAFLRYHPAAGATGDGVPLKVHPDNPRYVTDGSGKAICLTGSHTWLNFQDIRDVPPLIFPPVFNYEKHLEMLESWHHNFIRLWAWEEAWALGGNTVIRLSPSLFARTGPGKGNDNLLKFDLTQFNPEYFQRLRQRIIEADRKGIYVGVMLFQGFSVSRKIKSHYFSPWAFHPCNKNNNINGIDGDRDMDGERYEVHSLQDSAILSIQKAYVRRTIDELNDLDNLVYEIVNEGHRASTAWQYELIRYIQEYERTKPKQHLVWMTFQWDEIFGKGTNKNLANSPAEIISPGADDRKSYELSPPVADGSKVILLDTDHLNPAHTDRQWVWKAFMRGYNPIYMDFMGTDKKTTDTRVAMGIIRRFAEKIDLAKMKPAADSTTGRRIFHGQASQRRMAG